MKKIKIKINIGYDTGNGFEPYDYIDDYIYVDENSSLLKIETEVANFVKEVAGYGHSYYWEELL